MPVLAVALCKHWPLCTEASCPYDSVPVCRHRAKAWSSTQIMPKVMRLFISKAEGREQNSFCHASKTIANAIGTMATLDAEDDLPGYAAVGQQAIGLA